MKVLVLLVLVGAACAAALPVEDSVPVEETEEVEPVIDEVSVPVADTEEVALTAEVVAADEAPKVSYLEYTKEVADARAAFQTTFDAVAAAEGPAPSYLDYTKEVADARADFQALYDAAAEGPVASYLDYTKEVADARADFQATYDVVSADKGPVASYLDYTKEVADARADFQATYDAVAAGVVPEVIVPEEAPVAVEEAVEVTDAKAGVFTIGNNLSPFYTNALAYNAFGIHSPFIAGVPVISNVKVDTQPLADVSPLTYSSLGFPGPFGFFGYPIVNVADAE